MFEIERKPYEPNRPSTPSHRLNLDEIVRPRDWNFVQDDAPLVFHRGSSSRRPRWVLLAWSAFATAVDGLIAFAMTCLIAMTIALVLSKTTGVSTSQVSVFLKTGFKLGFVGCVGMVFICYLLTFRVFVGCTVGEWACGIRLGEPRHRMSNDYSLRVIQRFFLVLFTGIVTLPLISILMGDDMAGRLCGLPLVIQNAR